MIDSITTIDNDIEDIEIDSIIIIFNKITFVSRRTEKDLKKDQFFYFNIF